MAQERTRELVQRGLRMKKAGNAIVARLGGREIHPVNVRVGGFYRAPRAAELAALLPELAWAREAARESLAGWRRSRSPTSTRDYEFVALRHPDEYPMSEGRIVSSRGLDIAVARLRRALRRGAGARTRPRCTRGCARAARTSAVRSRAST